MITGIDLMPRSCREVLGRRLLIRRWSLVYALTVTVLFGGFWLLRSSNAALIVQRNSMAAQVKINWNRSEVVSRLIREISEVEAAVTRYNRLAWPVRVTQATDALAAVLPPQASLTEISITPREEKGATGSKSTGRGKPGETAAEPPRTYMIVEMEGLADSDVNVASFVSGLDANPLFSRVNLDFSRAKSIGGTEARNFRVTAEIDLSVRYSFAEAAGEGD